MKRSVSLPADDLAALDDFARSVGLPLRSAAIQRAIRRLRHPDPEDNYIGARDEWMASGEQDVWGGAVADDRSDPSALRALDGYLVVCVHC